MKGCMYKKGIHDNPVSSKQGYRHTEKKRGNTGYLPHTYTQAKEGWMGWEKSLRSAIYPAAKKNMQNVLKSKAEL